jgi:hypothetical protein
VALLGKEFSQISAESVLHRSYCQTSNYQENQELLGILESHHLALQGYASGMGALGTGAEFRTGLAGGGQEPRISDLDLLM